MSNQSATVELQISGMDCANCALGITRKLGKSGNTDVNVNFATGEASLLLGENCTVETVVKDIESLGYKVVSSTGGEKLRWYETTEGKFWFCLVFTVPLFFSHMLFDHMFVLNQPLVQLALCIPVFVLGAWHFGRSAFQSLKTGVPNMDVLIILGSSAAFVYSIAGFLLYPEHEQHNYMFFETTATILTLVLLGNVIEHRSVKRTTTAITELSKLQPERARRLVLKDGKLITEDIEANLLRRGDTVQVNTGDTIPADGKVESGDATVDESMFSGESIPVTRSAGAAVSAGTLLLSGSLRVSVERVGSDSTLSKIIRLVKDAQRDKPPVQKLGDKISAIFVPVVTGIALLTFAGCYWLFDFTVQRSIMNAVAVLVISCPCAMGLATPTAVMVGIGRAARKGILIRGGSTLETLAEIKCVAFDKTGTLTTGRFEIASFELTGNAAAEEVRAALYALEQHSSHPVATSLVRELKKNNPDTVALTKVNEEKGRGITGTDTQDNVWQAGSARILPQAENGTPADIYVLKNGEPVARINLQDELKPGVGDIIAWLHSQQIETVLISGDKKEKCEAIVKQLGIKTMYAEQLPEEKLLRIEELNSRHKTAMVGDGINDAPALARAAVGISLSDATAVAVQSAQVILLNGKNLDALKDVLLIGKHSLKTIRQNLFWAFFYNVVAIPVAAAGLLSPMVAALSMAFSDVVVIGNSIRLRSKKLK